VTVDVSTYALRFRRERGPSLTARLEAFRELQGTLPPALQAVAAQIAVPFEWSAAYEYGRVNGVRVIPVGDDAASERLLAELETELFAPSNLAVLAALDGPGLAADVRAAWARAHAEYRHPRPACDEADARLVPVVLELASGHTVHVGGWQHLEGLRRRFGEAVPVQVELLVDG